MTRSTARRRLRKAIGRLKTELDRVGKVVGVAWEDRPGPTTAELKDAKKMIDRFKKLPPGTITKALRKRARQMGDKLFDYADKSSAWVAKKAKDLAWSAWKLSVGPIVILGGLWLLSQLD